MQVTIQGAQAGWVSELFKPKPNIISTPCKKTSALARNKPAVRGSALPWVGYVRGSALPWVGYFPVTYMFRKLSSRTDVKL